MATREAVMQALLAVVQGTASYQTSGRRLRAPESITPAQSPAVFLVESGDEYAFDAPRPRRLTLNVKAFFYNNVGDDDTVIPSTLINNALDALDAALAGDVPTGLCTLGGLVYSCRLSGEGKRASGELTGQALAVVPIKIVFP